MTQPDTVLVVDDEPDLASLYSAWLIDEYDVTYVTRGREALDILTQGFDALILDRQMPEMSGDEILTHLRQRGNDIPITLVTASKPDVAAFDLQFDEYLIKPINRDDIKIATERLLLLSSLDEHSRECIRLSVKISLLQSHRSITDSKRTELLNRFTRRFETAVKNAPKPITDLPIRSLQPSGEIAQSTSTERSG